jgi:hypothetical protein
MNRKICVVSFLIVMCASVFFSCKKEGACLQYAVISTKMKFVYTNDSLAVVDTILPKPIVYFGQLYNTEKNRSEISFLPNSNQDSMSIIFAADSAAPLFDTISLYYTRQKNFISKECGFTFFYTINAVSSTTNRIEEIKILNGQVNSNNLTKHLQLFLKR